MVSFGGVAATSFTVVSPTSITAVVGAGVSGDVAVTTAGGQSTLAGFNYTGFSISSFTPTSGTSGAAITITGTNFTGATAVSFGGVAATSFTVLSSTTITAVLGSGNPGNVNVTTSKGTATQAGFTYTGPIISSFSPVAGNTGTMITIRGLNFTGTTSVNFGGTPAASFSVISPDVITAIVGSGMSGVVAVTTPIGPGTRDGFTFSTTEPIIAAVTPSVGTAGDVITITGFNFSSTPANNIVYFGSVKAIVSAATTTSLTVTVPAGATYSPVSVTTNNLTAWDSKPFMPTFAGKGTALSSAMFPSILDFYTAENNQALTMSDLDGDGKSDIVVANLNGFTVLQNASSNGIPSFAGRVDHATGAYYTTGVTAGDLDGDGKPELMVAGEYPDDITIFYNKSIPGTISFSDSIHLSAGYYPRSTTVGDLDGDGKPDLVVSGISNLMAVFRNTSTPGHFSFGPGEVINTGQFPGQVIITDLNGDGKSDLAVANAGGYSSPGNTISIFKNTSIGSTISFDNKVDFQTGVSPDGIAAGDLDGDGKPELSVTNSNNGTVSIFRNNNAGTDISFLPRIDYVAGTSPGDVAFGDLDGDGKPDMVVANQNPATISLYKNTSAPGAVSFNPKVDCATAGGHIGMAIGDVDGDGKPDLTGLYSRYDVFVLKNKLNDPSPILTASGAISFCEGGSVVLYSSATNTQWYKNGIPINGYGGNQLFVYLSGVYTASVTVGGVVYPSANAIIVTAYNKPPKPSISQDAVKGLVSSSATGNQWYSNGLAIPGATAQSYKPAAAGTYAVQVTENGCISPWSDLFNYVITATIDLGGNGRYLRIAPNPVQDFVKFSFNFPGVNTLAVQLSDINGRVMQIRRNIYSDDVLNVSGLAAGIYFLKVYSSNGKINVTSSIFKK